MAKGGRIGAGVSPAPSGVAPVPPQGGSGVQPAAAPRQVLTCRCGGLQNVGTLPDGTPAEARIALVPQGCPTWLSPSLGPAGAGAPVLEAAILICTACRRIELVWNGK